MNKPVYLGLSILKLSEVLRYEFWYDYVKPKYVLYSGVYIKRTPLGPEKSVCFIESPYKKEYLAKINQEWVFEVNRFQRVKKGYIE